MTFQIWRSSQGASHAFVLQVRLLLANLGCDGLELAVSPLEGFDRLGLSSVVSQTRLYSRLSRSAPKDADAAAEKPQIPRLGLKSSVGMTFQIWRSSQGASHAFPCAPGSPSFWLTWVVTVLGAAVSPLKGPERSGSGYPALPRLLRNTCRPRGTQTHFPLHPGLTPWARIVSPAGSILRQFKSVAFHHHLDRWSFVTALPRWANRWYRPGNSLQIRAGTYFFTRFTSGGSAPNSFFVHVLS